MKSAVGHRNRKNPKSREAYEKANKERNAQRGKQTFNPDTKTWTR